jgi:tetrahydromethanopterin S-methyltransferase subunit G
VWDAVQELKRDMHEIEVDLPRNYVSKNDFNETMRHIEDMFQRIYDKLDDKVDK